MYFLLWLWVSQTFFPILSDLVAPLSGRPSSCYSGKESAAEIEPRLPSGQVTDTICTAESLKKEENLTKHCPHSLCENVSHWTRKINYERVLWGIAHTLLRPTYMFLHMSSLCCSQNGSSFCLVKSDVWDWTKLSSLLYVRIWLHVILFLVRVAPYGKGLIRWASDRKFEFWCPTFFFLFTVLFFFCQETIYNKHVPS